MMQIDFLPEKYRDQYHIRIQRMWRVAVVVLFVGVVASSAGLQYWMRRDAEEQLDAITTTHVESLKINQRLTTLFETLDEKKHRAELLTYLRHRWPATQLLRNTLVPLEDVISLTSWSLYRQVDATANGRRQPLSTRRNEEQKEERKPAAVEDLERLRGAYDSMRTMIDIEGTTRDVNALHRYVAKLTLSALFEDVSLVRLESEDPAGGAETMRFQIRILVKRGPGQGQPEPRSDGKLALRDTR